MRRLLPAIAIVATVGLSQALAQSGQFSFFVRVVDGNDKPPATLTTADLRVQEGGVDGAVARVEAINWPMKVTLLIDNGTGLGQSLQQLRVGAKGFIEALPVGVEAALVTTAPQPRFIVRPTTDRLQLLQGVDRIAPDTSAARFTEALIEAAGRIDRDRSNHFPVIVILGSTAAEGSSIVDRDITKMFGQLSAKAATVHVVMVSNAGAGVRNGAVQTEVGIAVAKQTGGRYEAIAAPSRLATLLPEIGAQVAKSDARQHQQFRITFERPSSAKGPVGEIGLAVPAGFTPTLTLDGHLP